MYAQKCGMFVSNDAIRNAVTLGEVLQEVRNHISHHIGHLIDTLPYEGRACSLFFWGMNGGNVETAVFPMVEDEALIEWDWKLWGSMFSRKWKSHFLQDRNWFFTSF